MPPRSPSLHTEIRILIIRYFPSRLGGICSYRCNDSGGSCSGRTRSGWEARTARPRLLCCVEDYDHYTFGKMKSVNWRYLIAVLVQDRGSLGSGGPLNSVIPEIILRFTRLLHEVWLQGN